MNKTDYGFAILGTGAIAGFHAEQLGRTERARLVAVYDPNPDKASRFAKRYGCRAYSELDELLRDPAVDIVNICTPSSLHGEQTIVCAAAGKHVVTEKPMDIDPAQAERMIDACRAAGTRLGVISQHRLDPSVERLKQLLDEGAFGKLVLGSGSVNWYRSQDYYDRSSWRGTWKWDGGGALMNQGIHVVDLLQYLMGPVESVQACCDNLGHPGIEVEDTAAAALRYRSGALGTLVCTTSAYPGLCTRIEIFGTAGSAVIENDRLIFCKYRRGGVEAEEIIDALTAEAAGYTFETEAKGAANPMSISGETHRRQFADMIAAIEEGRDPLIDGREGKKPLDIIRAIYQAGATKEVVLL